MIRFEPHSRQLAPMRKRQVTDPQNLRSRSPTVTGSSSTLPARPSCGPFVMRYVLKRFFGDKLSVTKHRYVIRNLI